MTTDEEVLAELKRANRLKEREVQALEQLAQRPRPRNALETISHWWNPDPSSCMRMNY